jgi:hypothetical protein
MRIMRNCILLATAAFLGGCAAYKELEPDPELLGREHGYAQITDGKEPFEIDKDTKYFMNFPPPEGDQFYLVLHTPVKRDLVAVFTPAFDDKPVTRGIIADEWAAHDSIAVYPMTNRVKVYTWVIDTVRYDMKLPLRYRYVPQWRWTFETKFALYRQTFHANLADRSVYEGITEDFSFDGFDFGTATAQLASRNRNVSGVSEDLGKLESVFPPSIATSNDTAYTQYRELRTAVDEELRFQESYGATLALFQKDRETRGNVAGFLDAVPSLTKIMTGRTTFSPVVRERARRMLLTRLGEVTRYYDGVIRAKNDVRKISPDPSVELLLGLYRACGQEMPADMGLAVRFVDRFNAETAALTKAEAKFSDLKSPLQRTGQPLTEAFFQETLDKANEIRSTLQEPRCATMEKYGSAACAQLLAAAITSTSNRTDDLIAIYQGAREVAASVGTRSWGAAESRLVNLYEGRGAHDVSLFGDHRALLVRRFEEEIYTGVKQSTFARVDSFARRNEGAIDNVPALYLDSAFLPVYQITFSSAGPNDLLAKRKEIENYLEQLKYRRFPETAIKLIYQDFVRNISARGVEKARAIVEHGKYYRGDDRQIKTMISECDPTVEKWIVKPKEYRKVFALPTSSNRQGLNDYRFRIRLQIPSEAQFPVFDVNIKVPQELAATARQEQWYDEITLNKKPVKNEGRFRIVAPTAENNYEMQMTPLQMDKDGANVLEVRFRAKGLKVFEVSAMAQVPIIRKN